MSRSAYGTITGVLILGSLLCISSCKRGPETREPFSLEIHNDVVEEFEDIRWVAHEVKASEVLPGSRYLYVRVEEGEDSYWIATGSSKITAGERYVFNEAVVKYDFRSESLDRTFDSIYLVTQFLPEERKDELKRLRFNPHAKKSESEAGASGQEGSEGQEVQQLTIEELLDDPKPYENQQIELSGVCTKVNAGIMDRNWIHLKQGPDDTSDIVATSDALPKVGETITIRAIVRLEKDFGSGYSYPVLLEEAILVE